MLELVHWSNVREVCVWVVKLACMLVRLGWEDGKCLVVMGVLAHFLSHIRR